MENTTKKIDSKILKKVYWRSMFEMSTINYERFQALGFLHSMTPVLKHLYTSEEDRRDAMQRHMTMYNSNPYFIEPILGTVIALEEKKASGEDVGESINNMKVGLMGPFAGIGDSIMYGSIRPILAGIGATLALEGNVLGPIIFLVLWNIMNFGFRWYTLKYGYEMGVSMLGNIKETNIIQKIAEGSAVLGLMVLGVLVAQWVTVKTGLEYQIGDTIFNLQAVLDGVIPNVLPLLTTFLFVNLLRKRVTPNNLIWGVFAVTLVLSLLKVLV